MTLDTLHFTVSQLTYTGYIYSKIIGTYCGYMTKSMRLCDEVSLRKICKFLAI
jgi:hypothetical protein